jgi:hypothetical protein
MRPPFCPLGKNIALFFKAMGFLSSGLLKITK